MLLLLFCSFWDRVLHRQGRPPTRWYIAKENLELPIPLLICSWHWYYRCTPIASPNASGGLSKQNSEMKDSISFENKGYKERQVTITSSVSFQSMACSKGVFSQKLSWDSEQRPQLGEKKVLSGRPSQVKWQHPQVLVVPCPTIAGVAVLHTGRTLGTKGTTQLQPTHRGAQTWYLQVCFGPFCWVFRSSTIV